MTVLKKLLEVRADLENTDRDSAMKALMKRLYYEVAPCVESGDTYKIFDYEYTVEDFCRNNNLDIRAMKWLFEAMESEKLLSINRTSVTLTSLGIEKLCLHNK